MARQLIPGVFLPSLTYFAAASFTSTLVALVIASSIPLVDTVARVVRGRRPSPVGLVFVLLAGTSIGLGLWFRSPLVMLARGAVVSVVMGVAFAISAAVRRPLTRTAAIMLSAEHAEGRRRLAERWRHPSALSVFRALATGWAVLLLLSAGHQTALALTVHPTLFMALEPPLQIAGTLIGIGISVAYVRRAHRARPELGLLPQAAS